jgi:hypothetical protein
MSTVPSAGAHTFAHEPGFPTATYGQVPSPLQDDLRPRRAIVAGAGT